MAVSSRPRGSSPAASVDGPRTDRQRRTSYPDLSPRAMYREGKSHPAAAAWPAWTDRVRYTIPWLPGFGPGEGGAR